jgi:hypothetical protein
MCFGSWSVHEEAQFFTRVLKFWELPQKLFQKSWLEDHWNREGISRKSRNAPNRNVEKPVSFGKVTLVLLNSCIRTGGHLHTEQLGVLLVVFYCRG